MSSNFDHNSISLDAVNASSIKLPDKSTQAKVYLDKATNKLMKLNFDGSNEPLSKEQEIKYYETKVEADADQAVLSFTLPNPLKLVSNLEVALKKLIEGNKQETLINFQETIATLKSYQDSQGLANNLFDSNIKDIENKVSELIDSKVSESDFEVALNSIKSEFISILSNIQVSLNDKVSKSDLKNALLDKLSINSIIDGGLIK